MKPFAPAVLACLLGFAGLVASQGAFAVSNTYAVATGTGAAVVESLRLPPASFANSRVQLEADPGLEYQIKALKQANTVAQTKILHIGVGREVPRSIESGAAALRWTQVNGGIAAQWSVSSPGARALRVGLDPISLPEGTEIRFAGEGGAGTVYGPFTASDVFGVGATYWSPVLEGDASVVEVFIPGDAGPEDLVLAVTRVSHLFASPRDADLETAAKVGESQPCERDLICESATNPALATVGKAVARMSFILPPSPDYPPGTLGLCTGTLLNPLAGPLTPYFYSAAHCISTQATATTLTTHWFYDRAACGTGSPAFTQLTGGATLLYSNATSDALLLRLNGTPPAGAVYAGWDSTQVTTGAPITAVHHPAGDVKKVSLGTIGGLSLYGGGAGSTHIIALWNSLATGVTEGGSSGSGIFSPVGSSPVTEYRLRGGLHGGPSSCSASGSGLRDYYSRFDQAFPSIAQYLNPATSCSYSLAPTSASVVAMAGSHAISITTSAGCAWTASSPDGWITTSSSGSGSGTVFYFVGTNTGSTRTGTLTVGGQTFSITQADGSVPALNPARLANISTRGQVLTGNDVMIAGFIIAGAVNKTVVVNVAGPSLAAHGITNPLANPTLTLVRSADNAIIASNDNWQAQAFPANATAIQVNGFAPANALEPAIIATLVPGAYTAIVTGTGGGTGVGLVGVFEVDQPEVPLINISTRGQVLTGNDVMIAGFIIQGSGTKTVVVNVAGPSLSNFGITNPLANPTLTIVRSSDNAVIATNDNWQTQANPAHVAAIQAAGFQPANTLEPAVLLTLPPGAYTAIVQGVGGGTGVGLVGVFTVP